MASDTPAPPAEPSDEALIGSYLHAIIEWRNVGNATTWDARNAAEDALRARMSGDKT